MLSVWGSILMFFAYTVWIIRRLRSQLCAPKAITATAHRLARLFYLLWTTLR